MNTYSKALAVAVKAIEKYTPASCDVGESLLCKVAALYEPGVTRARDIARTLGKSVQQIQQIIDKLATAGKV